MTNKITSKQIMYAAAAIIITTSLLTKQLYVYTKNEAWIAVLTGLIVSLLVIRIYSALAKKFPGRSLIEINEAVFGAVFGKIISALYIYFFFTIAALNTNIASNFVKGFVLPNTPVILNMILLVLVCLWAVRKGSVNLMKYSVFLITVTIAVLLLNTFLLLNDIDVRNLLPAFNLKPIEYLVGTHTISIIPLCDPFVFMMFIPDMQKPNETGKALSKGVLLGVVFLLLIVLRDTTVLGAGIAVYNFPSLMAVRQIDVGDVITRMDIVYVSILIMLMFYKVAIFFHAAVAGIQRLFRFQFYKFLVSILGVFLILYAMTVFRSASEHSEWLINGAASIHNTFFVVFLPLLTFIVAVIRGFFKANKAAENKT